MCISEQYIQPVYYSINLSAGRRLNETSPVHHRRKAILKPLLENVYGLDSVILEDHLINATINLDDFQDIPDTPSSRAGPSRATPTKKTVPIPSDVVRTSGVHHMPEIPDSEAHRCRLPGCSSHRARVLCTTCKVHLCLTRNRNCFKLFHEL